MMSADIFKDKQASFIYELTLLLLEGDNFETNANEALKLLADFVKLQSARIVIDNATYLSCTRPNSAAGILDLSLPMIEKGRLIGSFEAVFADKSRQYIDTLHRIVPLFSKALHTYRRCNLFLQTATLHTMERRFILHTYNRYEHNVALTAKSLGITQRQLRYRLKKYKQA